MSTIKEKINKAETKLSNLDFLWSKEHRASKRNKIAQDIDNQRNFITSLCGFAPTK